MQATSRQPGQSKRCKLAALGAEVPSSSNGKQCVRAGHQATAPSLTKQTWSIGKKASVVSS
eukprot:565810-Amphidinium_carterae.1